MNRLRPKECGLVSHMERQWTTVAQSMIEMRVLTSITPGVGTHTDLVSFLTGGRVDPPVLLIHDSSGETLIKSDAATFATAAWKLHVACLQDWRFPTHCLLSHSDAVCAADFARTRPLFFLGGGARFLLRGCSLLLHTRVATLLTLPHLW